MDDLVQQARDHAAVLSQLAHPLSEGMSDAKRLDEFVSIGNKAAALLTGLADEVARLREALTRAMPILARAGRPDGGER